MEDCSNLVNALACSSPLVARPVLWVKLVKQAHGFPSVETGRNNTSLTEQQHGTYSMFMDRHAS